MALTVGGLLNGKIQTDDGTARVVELFYLPENRTLRYALVDLGGLFSKDEVLANVDRLAPAGDNTWRLNMTGEELASAPIVTDVDMPLTGLPPLVVGPFGNTFSPLMLAARMGLVDTGADTVPEDAREQELLRDGTGKIFRLQRVSDLLGRPAFSDDGPMGTISDIRMSDALILTDVILDDEQTVSLTRLRRIADQGHAIFD